MATSYAKTTTTNYHSVRRTPSTISNTSSKRSNLERYPTLQDLVKKKTQIKLQLTDFEKQLLKKTWGYKTQNEPVDEKSISYMISSPAYWDKVYQLLKERSYHINLPSIKHQTAAFPGMIQMAILNMDDLNRMDDYLANLGRRHRRVLSVEPDQFHQLGAAMIDTMIDCSDSAIDFFYEIVDVWSKLYCFLANSIIQSFANDPKMLIDYEDPFQIPNIDVDAIIAEHFNGSSIRQQDTIDSSEDEATLFDKQEDNKLLLAPAPTTNSTVKEIPNQQEPISVTHEDDDDDEDDDADMYDIFRGSEEVSTNKKLHTSIAATTTTRPVSVNNFAQLQRSPLNRKINKLVGTLDSNNVQSSSSKKLGFFKRMAAKATLE